MRPSEEVLNEFYGLADLDSSARYRAVAGIVSKVKLDNSIEEYCIERLVSGLGSSRAAARVGYSTALCILLSDASDKWTLGSAYAIGHHLLNTAIVQSDAFNKDHALVLERELSLYRAYPFLGMTVAQILADISSKMDRKTFKLVVLPSIKSYLEGALTASSPEFVYVALLLRKKFSALIHDVVPFINKDGSCNFSDKCGQLLTTVKKCDKSAMKVFANQLLLAAREVGQFCLIYRNVLEKWSTSGDESKVLERIFETAEMSLTNGSDYREVGVLLFYYYYHNYIVLTVFSPEFMKRVTNVMLGKQGPQQRMLKSRVCDSH
uniref:MIF4G domain-containing protein n=1 Tax=Heterorhabditis bacteriophora TaxID=37862 RepID=A0A1I7XQI9_HETBA